MTSPIKWDPQDTSRDSSLPKIVQGLPFDASRRIYFPNPYISEVWDDPARSEAIVEVMWKYDRIGKEAQFRSHIRSFIERHIRLLCYHSVSEYADESLKNRRVELSSEFDAQDVIENAVWDNLAAVQELRDKDERRSASRSQERSREPSCRSDNATVSSSSRSPLTRFRVTNLPCRAPRRLTSLFT